MVALCRWCYDDCVASITQSAAGAIAFRLAISQPLPRFLDNAGRMFQKVAKTGYTPRAYSEFIDRLFTGGWVLRGFGPFTRSVKAEQCRQCSGACHKKRDNHQQGHAPRRTGDPTGHPARLAIDQQPKHPIPVAIRQNPNR